MKKNIKLGSYIVEKENGYLKVSHDNKSWNFRIAGTPEDIEKFFTDSKETDWSKYFEIAFAGVQTFTILAMQSPQYMEQWINWHNSYYENQPKEVNVEEDEAIVAEEKILHEMREETNKTE